MQDIKSQLRGFLQYIALQFIDHPADAQLRVAEINPKHLRFRLILNHEDVAILIGRNGFTASAIRSALKAAAERAGIQATLQIHSHDEEQRRMAALEANEIIEE